MKKVLKIVANKYVITGLAFVIWCLFFDQNDWLSLRERQKDLDTLNNNITFLNQEVNQMLVEKEAITQDRALIEKYARENYHMKRENEDVYVVDGK